MPIITVWLFTDPKKQLLGASYDVVEEEAGTEYILRVYRTDESCLLFADYQLRQQASFIFPDGNKYDFILFKVDEEGYLFTSLALGQESH